MQIAHIEVRNFRGIESGTVTLSGHTVFLGDNNVGKSTLLEAIDLVLGPERLSRRPVIDEHDFYAGIYLDDKGAAVPIRIEVVVSDLSDEQQRHFREHIEWWSANERKLLAGPPAEGTDGADVSAALRVIFEGRYDKEEDDFSGNTFFATPLLADGSRTVFKTTDKRKCGFLYLRTLRTGARALSLERGSLLDVILTRGSAAPQRDQPHNIQDTRGTRSSRHKRSNRRTSCASRKVLPGLRENGFRRVR